MNRSHGSARALGWFFVVNIVLCAGVFSSAPITIAQRTSSAVTEPDGKSEYVTGAVLWTQSSAEYRALAYQTFTLARLRLDQGLRTSGFKRRANAKPPAIIVDIDETVLDNTRYEASLVLRGLSCDPVLWTEWCQRAGAGAVPGALDFLKYAARRGIHVF